MHSTVHTTCIMVYRHYNALRHWLLDTKSSEAQTVTRVMNVSLSVTFFELIKSSCIAHLISFLPIILILVLQDE